MPNVTLEKVEKAFPDTSVKLTNEILEIFVTLIVCQYFQLKFADQQVNWNLVAKKAQTWAKKEAEKNGLGSCNFETAAQNLIN